jgi:4-nitrophenyl phosphatase
MSVTLAPQFKSLILDMDGVLWKADAPIGDLHAIFEHIHTIGLNVAFATNNGTLTPEQYVERLAKFGVNVDPWQVVTSALGMAELLSKEFPQGARVFAIGGPGVMAALQERNFELLSIDEVRNDGPHTAQAVVMGIDAQINFEKMREATLLVRRGVPFYATNPDKTFPTPRGEIPGAGAWISVIVTATGVPPIYAGKPEPYLLELARTRLGTTKEQTLVVGDRLETDIAGGQAAGMPTALVLSGVSTREQAKNWMPKVDLVVENLSALLQK